MEVTVLTEQRKAAVDLDQRIKTTAKALAENLFELCGMFYKMSSEKLYKELGYQNFAEYCESEVGIKRTQGFKYATIGESFTKQNVQSTEHFESLGTEKLYLLAKLDEPERETVQQAVNVEDVSVKELKAEIDRLKAEKTAAESDLKTLKKGYDNIHSELEQEKAKSNAVEDDKKRLERKLDKANEELDAANEKIADLESRPVEIAIQEDEEGKMAKVLVKELDRKLSEADQEHVNAMENQRKKYQAQINSLEEQLEQEKNKPAETITVKNDKGIFKAYYSAALSSFENLLKFVADCSDKDFCIEKAEKLLEICKQKLGEIT